MFVLPEREQLGEGLISVPLLLVSAIVSSKLGPLKLELISLKSAVLCTSYFPRRVRSERGRISVPTSHAEKMRETPSIGLDSIF